MVVREATRHGLITRGLLWCGVAAGPLFLVTALAEGATRADYHPLRHPVSSLALGPHGWMQVANFLVAGALYLSYAVGLWRAPRTVVGTGIGAILIGVAAVGLLGRSVRHRPSQRLPARNAQRTGGVHDFRRFARSALDPYILRTACRRVRVRQLVPKQRQPPLGDLLNWLSGDDACL